MPLPIALIHEADRAALWKALHAAARAPGEDKPCDYTLRVRAGDGACHLVRLRGAAVRNDAGVALRVAGYLEDITESQSGDEQLRLLQEVTDAGAWELTFEPFSLACSPEAGIMLGLEPGKTQSSKAACVALFHPADRRRVERAIGLVTRRRGGAFRRVGPFRARVQHGDGGVRLCDFHCVARRNRLGDVIGLIGTVGDATRQAEAELRRKQSQKLELVGQFASGVAHDFNNFLSVIMGNLDLVRDTDCSPDARRYVEEALAAARKGEGLTRKLLSFARAEDAAPGLANLNRVIGDIDGFLHHILPEAIRVELRPGKGLWPVELDIAAFENALLNLVVSARDSMEGSGTIVIETANRTLTDASGHGDLAGIAAGRYVMVSVSDTGAKQSQGGPKEAQNPLSANAGWTNCQVGAAVARELAKQAGGHVRVHSGPGNGVTIRLLFPALGSGERAEARTGSGDGGDLSGRVLLVEDEPLVMRMMERRLRKLGLDCVTASSGSEALRCFEKDGPFDLLITDVVMPGAI